MHVVNNRSTLLSAASLLGLGGLSPLTSALSKAKNSNIKQQDITPVFTDNERIILKFLVESIIPRSQAPSAFDLKVHESIVDLVSNHYTPREQLNFLHGFTLLNKHCMRSFGYPFLECDDMEKAAVLEAAEKNSLGIMKRGLLGFTSKTQAKNVFELSQWRDLPKAGGEFFSHVKGLTTLFYYTGEHQIERASHGRDNYAPYYDDYELACEGNQLAI